MLVLACHAGLFSQENDPDRDTIPQRMSYLDNGAIRIGVNHGSLAESILDEFGDTPEGMVESAMRFLRVCRDREMNRVVVSMKSSNPRVMVYSVRLLADTDPRLADAPETDPDVGVSGEDLAYLIYTSGSTGKPKGIPLTHAQLAMNLPVMSEVFQDKLAGDHREGAAVALDDGRLDQAQAALKIKQKALEDANIVAPFDGVIAATFVENFQHTILSLHFQFQCFMNPEGTKTL